MSVLLCFSSCAGLSRHLLAPWLGGFGGCAPDGLCSCLEGGCGEVGSGSSAVSCEKIKGNAFRLHQGMFRSVSRKKKNH